MRKEASSQIVRFMILVRLGAQVFGQDYIGHFKKNAEEIICTLKHLCNRESQYVFQTSKKAYVAQWIFISSRSISFFINLPSSGSYDHLGPLAFCVL